MNLLIVYHLRLGDIARCLPIAKFFADRGDKVYFECNEEYHGLFELVDYCKPVAPWVNRSAFDRVLDLQIWPDRFNSFQESGQNWTDFVFGLLPEGGDIDRNIVLNSPAIITPPELRSMVLCFPTGYSQRNKIDPRTVVFAAHMIAKGSPVLCAGKKEHGLAEFGGIEYLCAYIRDAGELLTINTSASILASALRKSWWHVAECPQDDFFHPNQIRIKPDAV
jgi:hypothetical protein